MIKSQNKKNVLIVILICLLFFLIYYSIAFYNLYILKYSQNKVINIITIKGDYLSVEHTYQNDYIRETPDRYEISCGKCNTKVAVVFKDKGSSLFNNNDIKYIWSDKWLTAYQIIDKNAKCHIFWISNDHTACGGSDFLGIQITAIKSGEKKLFKHLSKLARYIIKTYKWRSFPNFYEILLASGDLNAITTIRRYANGIFTAQEKQSASVIELSLVKSSSIELLKIYHIPIK